MQSKEIIIYNPPYPEKGIISTSPTVEDLLAENSNSLLEEPKPAKKESKTATTEDQVIIVTDAVSVYLKEIGKVPLLNHPQEIELAETIYVGRVAEIFLSQDPPKDTELLEQRIAEAKVATDHFVCANTRLVVSIAKKYFGRGVPFSDLIQEGNLGLFKAAEKFEHERGHRFSTYATWWVRQKITRAIADQGRTIRVPVHMIDHIRLLYKKARRMEQNLGHPPTVEELAERLEMTPKKVQWMLQVSRLPYSLEQPVGEDGDSVLGDFVEDIRSESPSKASGNTDSLEKIEAVLATLTPRQARILRLRFGLHDGHRYTLEEVGQKYGLTRERIRQIEGKALRRLRHPKNTRKLRELL